MDKLEIANRLVEVMTKLDNLGVFYGNNYDSKWHDKYPHSCYWLELRLDKHRGGFESLIADGCGDTTTELSVGIGNTPTEMLLDLLENTYNDIVKDLGENVL